MAVSLEQFTQQLTASGLITAADLQAFQAALSDAAAPKSGDDLARELVRAGKLTKYQAAAVVQGKIKGLRFGEYVVLDKLGAGGMGVVLKAEHRRMKRTVAVKVLPATAMKNSDTVDRFYREVQAAAKLSHPNIVAAYDAGEHEGMHYLVMEYVEGRDLAAVVSERGALGVKEAVECIIQAARGLEYSHAHGVVHRDIKPANLLWAKNGTVKILDMGLARLREDGLGATDATAARQLTQSGQIMGTVDYMSPEQAEDTRKADHRADIYSLGCTLYRLVTAENPFDGETLMQKLIGHREKPVPSLTEALQKQSPGSTLPGSAESVNAVFQRMLAKRPEDRQQSMAEVIAELSAAIAPAKAAPPKRAGAGNSTTSGAQGATGDSDQFSFLTTGASVRAPAARPESDIANVSVLSVGPANSKKRRLDKRVLLLGLGGGGAALFLVAVVAFFAFGRGRTPVTEKPVAEKPSAKKPTGETPKTGDTKSTLPVNQAVSDALAGQFALEFDGKSYVEIPTLKLTQGEPCTIEFFLSDCGVGKTQNVFEITGDGASARLAYTAMEGGSINWTTYAKPSHDGVTAFYSVLFPSWKGRHHAAFLFSNEKNHAGFFVNGNRIDSSNKKGFGFGTPKHSGMLLGARRSDGQPVEFLMGRLAGVRVSRTLRYTRAFEPPAQLEKDGDTLALYRCDEGTGDTLKDSSGNNHHGKIVGAKWVPADAGSTTVVQPAATPPSSTSTAGKVVNLLPLIDPEKDGIQGKWAKLPGTGALAVLGDNSGSDRLEIPYHPPAEYDFTIQFIRQSGNEAVGQMFSWGNSQLMWNMGAWANSCFGFEMIDGKKANTLPGSLLHRTDLLKSGKDLYTSRLEVRKLGVTAYLNDQKLVEQGLNFTTGNLDANWKLRDVKSLGLGSYRNNVAFLKIEVKEISGPGVITRAANTAPAASPATNAEWSAPVNLGPLVNSRDYDAGASLFMGEQTLLFSSNREARDQKRHLWFTARQSSNDPWSKPMRLDGLNSQEEEIEPDFSFDGLALYFASSRAGGRGGFDIWTCRRSKTTELLPNPVLLAGEVNGPFDDGGPAISTDGLTLVFHSNRTKGQGGYDLWQSTRAKIDDPFGPPVNLGAAINSTADDGDPAISGTGLRLVFMSKRAGGEGEWDLWTCRRGSTHVGFEPPVNLGKSINTSKSEAYPWLSGYGERLYFTSDRAGGQGDLDLWMSTFTGPERDR